MFSTFSGGKLLELDTENDGIDRARRNNLAEPASASMRIPVEDAGLVFTLEVELVSGCSDPPRCPSPFCVP